MVVEARGMVSLGESSAVEPWQSAKLYCVLPGLKSLQQSDKGGAAESCIQGTCNLETKNIIKYNAM